MNISDQLERHFDAYDLFGHGTVIAVSGGADSVALLRAFAAYARRTKAVPGRSLVVAHLHHGLRETEADADAEFVRKLAETTGLPYVEQRVTPGRIVSEKNGSLEDSARRFRYDFLRKTAEKQGFRYVATAHTRDDQLETVLHRIIRGTGIAGLRGIPVVRRLSEAVTLVRPLLAVDRAAILAYLRSLHQPFRTDVSNTDLRHTRNRIRNRLLPLLRDEFNSRVDEAILRLAVHAREERTLIDSRVEGLLEQSTLRAAPDTVTLDRERLHREPDFLIREMLLLVWRERNWPLRHMGSREWNALTAMLRHPPGLRREFPDGILAETRDDGDLTLTKRKAHINTTDLPCPIHAPN
ncbi:MAG TPA: tRNA lysidine(34) synthetase TilS [Planctomycetaceae bacterium]|nr:tRNA lysidine(34) synthetase TilS [Planctomycetaceae bacterium]